MSLSRILFTFSLLFFFTVLRMLVQPPILSRHLFRESLKPNQATVLHIIQPTLSFSTTLANLGLHFFNQSHRNLHFSSSIFIMSRFFFLVLFFLTVSMAAPVQKLQIQGTVKVANTGLVLETTVRCYCDNRPNHDYYQYRQCCHRHQCC